MSISGIHSFNSPVVFLAPLHSLCQPLTMFDGTCQPEEYVKHPLSNFMLQMQKKVGKKRYEVGILL